MSTPISPPPVRAWRPGALPAYLSNGLVGLRVLPIPLLGGVTIVNGLAGVDPDSGAESFARAPYPLHGDLEIDGLSVHDAPECARLREQVYDFATGELTTRFSFDAPGVLAEVEMLTFCSRSLPTLVLQETVVRVERACDLALSGGVDHVGVPGTLVERDTRTRGTPDEPVGGSLRWKTHGDIAQAGVAYVTEFAGGEAERGIEHNELAPLRTRYALRARAGRRYRLRQVSALVADSLHAEPDLQAVRLAYAGMLRGFDRLRRENREAWEDVWRGRVELVGAPARWQALADAAFYYLHASVHPSSPASTSLFGLAFWPNYHYYRGHVMWDIDLFALAPLVLTFPDAARTLLEFRSDRLAAARTNAKMSGYRGAQFPWESSIRYGHETSPGEGPASAHEHHVSLDIAFAFSQFVHATHDWQWARERAWPLVRDVAEWLESRGVSTKRGFEIHEVNGIAELPGTVDNNAFVNMVAAVVFREAVGLARPLGQDRNARWERYAREVFLAIDPNGVIRNHDRHRIDEPKGATPEALAGLFPVTYDCSPEIERATLDFYVRHADEYVGAPMLSALLGLYAARLGDRERSLELFERGYAEFVVDPYSVALEYHPGVFPDQELAGPFMANMGGFLTSLIYGLPGLRLDEGEPQAWCSRPVAMPEGWDGIRIERLWARGRTATLTAMHGDAHAALVLDPDADY